MRGAGRRGARSLLQGIASGYGELASAIRAINTELLTDDREVAHYTSLHVLRDLAERGNPFRLYNSAYMNDPEEGRVFFKIMKDEFSIDVKEYENDSEDSHSSPAYIGSFVQTGSRNKEGKDKLFLWRTYGKHNNEEAAGACLIFDKDQFARSMKTGTMPRLEYGVQQGLSTGQNDPLPLYRVIYKSEIGKLSKSLKKLALSLEEINKLLPRRKRDRKMFIRAVRGQLDHIRFLFKADHYRGEEEVRVVQIFYDTGGHPPAGRKVELDQIPPRFYLEMPDDFRFNEVILGPKAGNVSEWKQLVSEKNGITVEQSKIPFR